VGTNGAVSYTLGFDRTYLAVSWKRTELLAGSGGVLTPAWRAYAYDAQGNQVGTVGENQVASFTNLPARGFTLAGSNIAWVTFTANNSLGTLASLPLDDLVLSTLPAGSDITLNLSAPNPVLTAPGQVTLQAQAADVGGTVTAIDFYQGQYFIGESLGASGSVTLASLAPGTNTFTAVASDDTGSTRSSAPLTLVITAQAGVSVIDFDDPTLLDTSSGAVGGAALSNYLAGFGVSITNATLGTRLEAVNGNNLSGNAIAVPSSPPNLLTQAGLNQPVTFTLALAAPVQSVGFTRVALLAGPGGISHPAWTAHALDAAGNELEAVSEGLIYSLKNVAARSFTLTGQAITQVRFDSDSQQTAAFSAVLLDDLVLAASTAGNPLSITLSSPGGTTFTAPANIVLQAAVNGTVDHINFYAGPALIGVAGGGATSITWTNVLNGTYAVTAQVIDTGGYARRSAPVQITVNVGVGTSTVVNFDQVTGSVASYLAQAGMTVASLSPGTSLAVESQDGNLFAASSPPNVLTQAGSNGPVSFTLDFAPLLTQFSFTRPELLASPFVTHPAWQVRAFDALGVELAEADEPLISSYTNVPAQSYTLSGAGIASVEFDSEGTSLTTFNALLLDDFILTTAGSTNLPPSVVLTNPLPGQVFTAPAVIELSAQAVSATSPLAQVNFYAGDSLVGTATASPYTILWTNQSVGSYALTAVALNNGLSRASAPVNITVQPSPQVFGLLTQPQSQTVASGGSVTFSVTLTGQGAVAYQWNFNGAPIAQAANSSFTLNPVTDQNAGDYTVTVRSGGQTLTSAAAVLTVVDPPSITAQPQSQTVNIGDTISLSVANSGTGPFYYQWLLNGTGIPGATNASYALAAAQPFNSGAYQVIVGNAVAYSESAVANVAVTFGNGLAQSADNFSNRISIDPLVGPVLGNNSPASQEPGEPSHAGKPGGKSIWYSWQASFTGVISLTTRGSTFDTLLAVYTGTNMAQLSPVAADDDSGGFFTSLVSFNCVQGTEYEIAVDGFQGASGEVVLGLPSGTGYRVLSPGSGDAVPVITQQPTSQVVQAGATVTLAVSATSASPLTYQWFFAGAPVAGAGGPQLVITNFLAGSVGNYYALVVNSVGSAQSATAAVQIGAANQSGPPLATTEDKFGDAVDLSTSISASDRHRPQDSGGDTGGFTLSQTFSTVGATKEAGEPEPCGQAGGASEWYTYTAPAAGLMHVDTAGSAFNTILAVYVGPGLSFNTLTNVACGYTTNYSKRGQPSLIIPGVAAKTKFYIAVDGYRGASGAAKLNIGLGQPPQITSAPQSQTVAPGGQATFQVTASGLAPLAYQWQFDGANLPGATQSSYRIDNAQSTAAGAYTVVVSNQIDVVTSALAMLAVQPGPLIAVEPVNSLVTIGQAATLSVSASGAGPLTYQWYSRAGPIAKATNATLTFAKAVAANSGSYYVVLKNPNGSVTSSVAVLTITSQVFKAPLTLLATPAGHGRISGAANQSQLQLGKKYSVTAAPLGNWLFANWSSNNVTLTNGPALPFTMVTNLVLQATFVTNPFTAVAGTYNGLFYPDSGVTLQSSGFFSAAIPSASRGTYSARVVLEGISYPFSGAFDLTGAAQKTIRPGRDPVLVALSLNLAAPDNQMTGTISAPAEGWSAALGSDRAVFTTRNKAPYAGTYTFLMPPADANPPGEPGGYGYGHVSITTAGAVTLSAVLGDNTAISQAVPISPDGHIPLYASLYTRQGLLLGWVNATPNPSLALRGASLTWIKLSSKAKTLYAGGFTNSQTSLTGAPYAAPKAGASLLDLTNATLTLSGGGAASALTYTNLSLVKGKLINGGHTTNTLVLTFNPANGAMNVTFRPTGSRANTTAHGVVLQPASAAGLFLTPTESGAFWLGP